MGTGSSARGHAPRCSQYMQYRALTHMHVQPNPRCTSGRSKRDGLGARKHKRTHTTHAADPLDELPGLRINIHRKVHVGAGLATITGVVRTSFCVRYGWGKGPPRIPARENCSSNIDGVMQVTFTSCARLAHAAVTCDFEACMQQFTSDCFCTPIREASVRRLYVGCHTGHGVSRCHGDANGVA